MTDLFNGFGPNALSWFHALARDNSRSFFEATRAEWEDEIRRPLEQLLTELTLEFGGVVKMFRQHRDVRFSKDKSPYKTTTYGIVHNRPDSNAALYVQLSARGVYAGTGYHELASDQLARFREAAAAETSGSELERTIGEVETTGLKVDPPELKSAPRGFPRDHVRVGLLRYKQLIVGTWFPQAIMTTKQIREEIAAAFRSAAPLNAWLDGHVGPSQIPPEVRYSRGRPR